MQRVQRDHAPQPAFAEPVDGLRRLEHAEFCQQRVERAVLPEDLANADRADKGREDHRHEHAAPMRAFFPGKSQRSASTASGSAMASAASVLATARNSELRSPSR